MEKSSQKNKYLAALGSLLLFAVYFPLVFRGGLPVDRLSSLVAIICFALLLLGAKKISHIFPALILYFLLYTATASHLLGSLTVLTLTSASLAANELILNRKNIWKTLTVYAFLPLSLALAYIFTKNVLAMIVSSIPFIICTVLFVGVKLKKNRKSVIIAMTATFVSIAIIALFGYMLISGKSAFEIRDAYISGRDALADYVCSYSVDLGGETVPLFQDAPLAKQLFVSMTNALPSIVIISLIVVSFFIYNYQASMLEKFEGFEYITEDIMEIKISTAAAAVYLLAFVFSITTDSYGNPPFGSVVCQNIYTILTPALVYSGFRTVRGFIKKKKIRLGFLLILPLVLLAMTGYMFMILSFVGIICIFAKSAKEWADKKD